MKTLRNEKGFTLIELIMVIVILGILAAFALPRYAGLERDARIATVQGLYGSVRAAAAIVHARALLDGTAGLASSSVTLEGVSVSTEYGYPGDAATGIDAALQDFTGYTYAAGVFTKTGATTPATCIVTYVAPAAVNTAPTITFNTAGC